MTFRSPGALIALIVGVVVLLFVAVTVFAVFTGINPGFPGTGPSIDFSVFAPLCSIFVVIFVVIIVVVVLAATQGWSQARIPPPPPIQQPMVPAGAQGPVALSCPNCGAPPQNVDRFGVATCTYCNTRFLVR
mgnify:CR=1 FL=1